MLDGDIRTLNVDLREEVPGIWDEDTMPIIQHYVMTGVGVSQVLLGPEQIQLSIQDLAQRLGLRVLGSNVYEYDSYRISLTLLVKGGSITVETYPKKGFVHLDLTVVLNDSDLDETSCSDAFAAVFSPNAARILNLLY